MIVLVGGEKGVRVKQPLRQISLRFGRKRAMTCCSWTLIAKGLRRHGATCDRKYRTVPV